MLLGSVTEVKDVQDSNADLPILVTDEGIVTDLSCRLFLKALASIRTTDEGIFATWMFASLPVRTVLVLSR